MALTAPQASVINGSIGGALGIATTLLNNHFAKEMAREDRAENYKYNEMSAENAYKRQIEMTENYMTPEAQIKHLRAAGLSPSIMYGAGGGTQGVSTPQGNGASGLQTTFQPYDLSSLLTIAQIKNINADTAKKEEDVKTIRGDNERGQAEISNILEQAGAYKAKAEYDKALTTGQNIDNMYKQELNESTILEIQKQTELYQEQITYTIWQAKKEKVSYEFDRDTFETRKKQFEADLNNTLKDTLLKNSQIQLNQKEIEEIDAKIQNMINTIDLKRYEIELQDARGWAEINNAMNHVQIEENLSNFNIEMGKKNFIYKLIKDGIKTALGTYAMFGVGGGSLITQGGNLLHHFTK